MESVEWPVGLDIEKASAAFKAYDIRGIAGDPLTPDFAYRLGRTLATFLDCNSLAVARDIRESGPELHASFVNGLNDSGVDAHDLGIMPTGALYHATVTLPVDGGVVITASHNPPEYNGFKMCRGSAAMAGDELQDLLQVFLAGNFKTGSGSHLIIDDFKHQYYDDIIASTGLPNREVKVVVDSGNAVPGPFMQDIL